MTKEEAINVVIRVLRKGGKFDRSNEEDIIFLNGVLETMKEIGIVFSTDDLWEEIYPFV